ncbi:hypothetical protein HOK68_01045 [Candidatus Woesearchaeota archaeon]|jgi:hypothetical protein|nr:hypothetical protein [Candidatus Woesearchaeota archaeon]MBT4387684.1 hypothetical protein [Candidatus Woesearchaeota archaeon]MBT4595953.1 hypothetical protein [Candidatus Woesearchaeota archaeon]MBT5741083.1 hypothetical protein [Candidatus Woesearchaeota archaeon]MBT6505347.1 hypothetical protein [Candidatus Woesearchaeota archaeon]
MKLKPILMSVLGSLVLNYSNIANNNNILPPLDIKIEQKKSILDYTIDSIRNTLHNKTGSIRGKDPRSRLLRQTYATKNLDYLQSTLMGQSHALTNSNNIKTLDEIVGTGPKSNIIFSLNQLILLNKLYTQLDEDTKIVETDPMIQFTQSIENQYETLDLFQKGNAEELNAFIIPLVKHIFESENILGPQQTYSIEEVKKLFLHLYNLQKKGIGKYVDSVEINDRFGKNKKSDCDDGAFITNILISELLQGTGYVKPIKIQGMFTKFDSGILHYRQFVSIDHHNKYAGFFIENTTTPQSQDYFSLVSHEEQKKIKKGFSKKTLSPAKNIVVDSLLNHKELQLTYLIRQNPSVSFPTNYLETLQLFKQNLDKSKIKTKDKEKYEFHINYQMFKTITNIVQDSTFYAGHDIKKIYNVLQLAKRKFGEKFVTLRNNSLYQSHRYQIEETLHEGVKIFKDLERKIQLSLHKTRI